MLVCAEDVPLSDILTNAAATAQGRSRLLRVDHQGLRTQSEDAYDEQVAAMLQKISEQNDAMLFFDLTEAERATVERLLSVLEPMLTETVGTPALVLALREPVHRATVRANRAFDTVFRTVWLHRLEDQKIPSTL
jgi:ferredoxin-NADP reductase